MAVTPVDSTLERLLVTVADSTPERLLVVECSVVANEDVLLHIEVEVLPLVWPSQMQIY